MVRKPLALSNWKMSMAITESLAFVEEFQALAGDLLHRVDVVICPPFTSLWAVAQALVGSVLHLGAQNIAATADPARTGQISAALLADAGCRWVMLGHWEVRRYLGDDDTAVRHKIHLALGAGLRPILLVGESRDDKGARQAALERHLTQIVGDCEAEQVAAMAFVYEPEVTIGAQAPATPAQVAAGCGTIRGWIGARWGETVAEQVRIIYGGSVTPAHAADLLAHPDVDGLGATRRGRDPSTFMKIVRQVVEVKLA